jgi:hypothetical protein
MNPIFIQNPCGEIVLALKEPLFIRVEIPIEVHLEIPLEIRNNSRNNNPFPYEACFKLILYTSIVTGVLLSLQFSGAI